MKLFGKVALFCVLLLSIFASPVEAGPITGFVGYFVTMGVGYVWGATVAPVHYSNPAPLSAQYGVTAQVITGNLQVSGAVATVTPVLVKTAVDSPLIYHSWVDKAAAGILLLGNLLPLP